MKTNNLIILFVFSVSNIFAQTDSLSFQKEIETLNNKIVSLESSIEALQKTKDNQVSKTEFENLKSRLENIRSGNTKILQELKTLKNSHFALKKNNKNLKNSFEAFRQNTETEIDSLQQIISSNATNIKKTAGELGFRIENTQKFTKESVSDLSNALSKNTLFWIIAVMFVALMALLAFVLLRKQILKQKTDLESNLQDTRKALEEESIKLDNKLIEVLETQLKIINHTISGTEKKADHTLALKVADEIVRIEKNISKMDSSTKGIKPLVKGIERIKDNLKANGYEMVQLLAKEYDDGMNIDVINFIDDEKIPSGKKIITRIIKPQVNYKDVLIQRAQVDVSQN